MSFTPCVHKDPFADRVRELYSANVVRAPRVGIDPLLVLAKREGHVEIRGALGPLLINSQGVILPNATEAPAPQMSGQRSAEVETKLGLKLAAGFLTALGVPITGVGLDGTVWKGSTGFKFEVRDVRERSIDVDLLGAALRGRQIDPAQPSAAIFFDRNEPVAMHVITRTLVSSQVVIQATGAQGQALEASTEGILKVLGEADASVSWTRESNGALLFQGPKPATFALAAVPCNLLPDGRFTLGLELRGGSYLDTPTNDESELLTEHLALVEDDGLLDVY